jgi:DNA-directed RNA polymerase specialized sigma24 family protein
MDRSPAYEVDCDLARRVTEGDRQALELLVDRHLGPLYKYLRRRLGPDSEPEAERIVFTTFDHALKRLGPYARGSASTPMRSWLFRLADGQVARIRKQSPAARKITAKEPAELTALRSAMANLPARQQAALCYALFEQMRPREIAHALGVGPVRAMRTLRAALRRVAARLDLQGSESDA